jgi:hypothetical protein
MLPQRLISCWCLLSVLAGCSDDKSSSAVPDKVPQVFIDSVFTTAWSSAPILRPPERGALETVELPCDGKLGVRLSYIDWEARAPGLCVAAKNCGHNTVKLALGDDLRSSVSVVATPALLSLDPPASWNGTATLSVELVHDDGTPYVSAEGAAIGDQVEIPLTPSTCMASGGIPNSNETSGGAGGSAGAG